MFFFFQVLDIFYLHCLLSQILIMKILRNNLKHNTWKKSIHMFLECESKDFFLSLCLYWTNKKN